MRRLSAAHWTLHLRAIRRDRNRHLDLEGSDDSVRLLARIAMYRDVSRSIAIPRDSPGSIQTRGSGKRAYYDISRYVIMKEEGQQGRFLSVERF